MPPPDKVSELPVPPEITAERVTKSVAVLGLSWVVIVRAPAFRFSGFWNSTSASEVEDPKARVPVDRKLAAPKAIVAAAPPILTVSFLSEAAKPTALAAAAVKDTVPPVVPSERVKLPEVSSTATPELPVSTRGLLGERDPRLFVTRSVPWAIVVAPE